MEINEIVVTFKDNNSNSIEDVSSIHIDGKAFNSFGEFAAAYPEFKESIQEVISGLKLDPNKKYSFPFIR